MKTLREAPMEECEALQKELARINTLINEAEDRLGAHSIKPILMQQLFALEEERTTILERFNKLKDTCEGRQS